MKHGLVVVVSFLMIWAVWSGASAVAGPYQQQVHQAQNRLHHLGYQPGTADGKMGPQTQQALKQFQRDHGLPPTGKLDRQTLQWLDKAESGKAKPKGAPQAAPADKRPGNSNSNMVSIQEWLRALGYHPGPSDGKMGPQTQQALKQFQRDHGLPQTGAADERTMKKMKALPKDKHQTPQGQAPQGQEERRQPKPKG